jgi:hypothetical protein
LPTVSGNGDADGFLEKIWVDNHRLDLW